MRFQAELAVSPTRNRRCTRSSLGQLGVECDREHRSLAGGHRVAVDLGEDLHVRAVLGDPRRADEDRRESISAGRRSPSRAARCRPRSCASGARTRCARARMSIRPRCSRSSMIRPAQEPSIGRARATSARSGSASPSRSIPKVIVVDSPPGITSPSRPSRSAGTRTSRTSARRARAAPARAPRTRPAARARRSAALDRPSARLTGYQPRWARSCSPSSFELSRLTIAGPSPREACATRSGSCQWVVASTIARARAGRVLGLEDARADEHAFGAERHHQRRVGRRGDAAGAEQHDRQAAVGGDLADELERRGELLRGGRQLGLARASPGGGSRR